MAWVKLDDTFPDHRKLAELGDYAPLCGWLYVCGLCFCNRQLTDGLIPKAHVARLVSYRHIIVTDKSNAVNNTVNNAVTNNEVTDTERLANMLVQVGLWEEEGNYYRIHDYLVYQPSREKVMASKASTVLRQQKFKSKLENNAVNNTVNNAVSNTVNNTAPVPVPVPLYINPPTPLKKPPQKKHYAEFVTLTEKQYSDLLAKHGPEDTQRMIDILSAYKGSRDKTYKSDYHVLIGWVTERLKEEKTKAGPTNSRAEIDLVEAYHEERRRAALQSGGRTGPARVNPD